MGKREILELMTKRRASEIFAWELYIFGKISLKKNLNFVTWIHDPSDFKPD